MECLSVKWHPKLKKDKCRDTVFWHKFCSFLFMLRASCLPSVLFDYGLMVNVRQIRSGHEYQISWYIGYHICFQNFCKYLDEIWCEIYTFGIYHKISFSVFQQPVIPTWRISEIAAWWVLHSAIYSRCIQWCMTMDFRKTLASTTFGS